MPMTLRTRKLPKGFWAKSTGRTTVVKKGRKSVPRASKALTKVIKSVVRRNEERKFAGLTVENTYAHNASITSGDLYSCVPKISQGIGYNQRVGDKLRPTSLHIDGVVSFNDYGQGYIGVPLHVVVFVLQAKKIRDPAQIGTAPVGLLLDSGLGAIDWDGTTLKSMYPINRDEFEVLGARTFKIGDVTAENPLCLSRRYSMKVKTPAVLNYDGGALTCNNFAPFVALGWCRDDGVTPGIADVYIKHTCSSRMYYTDA